MVVQKLKDFLETNKWTQGEFARLAEVRPSTVHKWVNGDCRPNWHSLAVIQKLTNGAVTAADFMPQAGETKSCGASA